ncbi:lipopolysaccharide-binding protein-like [Solea senegalensis]|uniref:Bactericidal permeability-increasing protein n=3 Tax=Solea senegalensis TaxID=28829 RepID=A0AAV6SRQ1_SOLSE|nr:lipopolysaccharide-binding protein [Solea senegalensis]KAG7519787.1 lipopolysaccharide-binding protein-like [Solea senegalensis]
MHLHMLVVLVLCSCTCGENPAIQIILNNKGLQYAKNTVTDWTQKILGNITLPDISGKVHIGFFGSIDYTLTGTSVRKCDLPQPSVEFSPGTTGVNASMLGLSVALTGEWKTHYGCIHDGGSFDMALFNVDVVSAVELGKNADGHLSITTVSCDAQVGYVDIYFRGGASWMFRPFVSHFRQRIRRKIESSICSHVEELTADLDYHLQTMNVSFDVDQALTMNLSLTGSPVIDVSSLNLGLKGEFFSIKTHSEPPFDAQPFTVPEQHGYMFSAGLSEFTLNSASYGLYSAGVLQALITDSMIPPDFPLHLNTSSMGPYIPQLPKMFPGLLMNLQVYATEVPMFSFQSGVVRLGFLGAVKAFAIQSNGTQTPLFKLSVISNLSSRAWVDSGRVKGQISLDNFTLTLMESEVGAFKITALEKCTRTGIEMGLAKLNEYLGKGVLLPRMKQAQLVNSVLKVEQGFIAIFSDAEVLK